MNDRSREATAVYRNVVYAERGERQLLMDVYRPEGDEPVPVALYLHGGGWRSGTKNHCLVRWLVRYGIAVASVDYRLLPRSLFPDQVHDAKQAVRFLRRQAEAWGLFPEGIVATGVSSGAYLANLLGVTAGVAELEGPQRADDPASHVNAVVNYFGFTDFISLQNERSRRGERAAGNSPEAKLLGHAVAENPERGRLASPFYHVHRNAPPYLHIHGELNEVIPLDQARRLHEALKEAGGFSKLVLVRGCDHRAPPILDNPSIRDRVANFIHTQTAAALSTNHQI